MSFDSIPLCEPQLSGNEWKYLKECLDTNWVSSAGTFVARFEEELARYVGCRHAVAVVNGTAALHIALLASNVQPDDEILVSTLSFIAPANAIRYAGAWPVFVDAEPQYWQMDCGKLHHFIEKNCRYENGELRNKITSRRVKAILPVHILGHSVDMDPILELAQKYNLLVVEDATESLGGKYKGKKVGSLGDVGCFSFNGNKLVTTGGGGMIVTDDEKIARRARYLATQAKDNPLEYIHKEIGYNYRLTNLQAAVGCAQMEKIEAHITAKRRIASRYTEFFSKAQGLQVMEEAPWAHSVFWMYTILVDPEKFGMTRRELMSRLTDLKIETRPLWQPLHLSAAHRGSLSTSCEVAPKIVEQSLSLPCSVGMKSDQQQRVIAAVLKH